jgi:hypothetical protein
MIASLLLLHMTRAMMHTVMLRWSTMDAPSLLHSMLITWAYLTHEMILSPLLLPTRVERVLSVVLTGITILLRVPSLPCERLRARGQAVPKHEKQMP